jgi:hypothetical protein
LRRIRISFAPNSGARSRIIIGPDLPEAKAGPDKQEEREAMSKAPKKAAAPSEPAPAAAPATSPAKSLLARKVEKPVEQKSKPPIDEAIEIALAAASTAVDSAQEIQRLRGEVQTLVQGSRRNNKILFYATFLILVFAGAGVFGSLVFFKRAYNEFEAVAKVNREALIVFAGEINGLVAASKKIDEALKASSQMTAANQALNEEVSKNLQALTLAQNALAQKIPPANLYDKSFSQLQKGIDELVNANKAMATRIAELQARPVAPPTPPAATIKPPVQAKPQSSEANAAARQRAEAARQREMIRFP